jgi:alpha-beta hydrolase superfamily lysophospholipase
VLNAADEHARRRARAGFVAESGRAFLDFATARVDETSIRIPVLTVAATRDRLIPARMTRRTAQKYAAIGGELVEYAQHGHWLYDEPGWETPAAEIFDWLASKTARTEIAS